MSRRCVLVGGGVSTATAAATLRARGFAGSILLVGDEPHPPYERPPLSKDYLTGKAQPGAFDIHPPDWYEDNDVDLRLGIRVTEIDTAERTVTLSTGELHPYDTLVLATGARPRELPGLPASDRIHYLRTLADAERVRARLDEAEHLVLLGAGFIGCEVAAAATTFGIAVTVFDPEPPLRRVVGARIGAAITNLHRARGVDVHAGDTLTEIVPTRTGLSVTSRGGHRLDCDLLMVGIGCVPNAELAAAAGIATGDGIVVDEYFATSAADVYAIGDVAGQYHPRYGRHVRVEHHDTARRQGHQLG